MKVLFLPGYGPDVAQHLSKQTLKFIYSHVAFLIQLTRLQAPSYSFIHFA